MRRVLDEHSGRGAAMRDAHHQQAREEREAQRQWAAGFTEGDAATFETETDAAPIGPGRYSLVLLPPARSEASENGQAPIQ